MRKSQLLTLLFIVFIFCSCGSHSTQENITVGTIEYEVSYPSIDKKDMMAAMMLPSKMILYFKDGKVQSEIGTGAIFKTIIVTDKATESGFQLLKIVNKKYILKLDSAGIQQNAYDIFKEVKVTATNETKEIAGYVCKKALVETGTGKKFEVFYCPNLGPKAANWFNPYKEIDGMIMEYHYKQYNLDMKFVAVKVTADPVKDEFFVEPKGYEPITKEKMAEIFENF